MGVLAGTAYLLGSLVAGVLLSRRLLGQRGFVALFFGCLLGIVLTAWVAYASAWIASLGALNSPVSYGISVSAFINVALVFLLFPRSRPGLTSIRPKNWFEFGFVILCLVFGFALMFATFGYNGSTQELVIDRLVHSDFASHIPLVRSFSMGENVPTEAPLMGGERIRYHFFFYFYAGCLERAGLPLSWAINLPSAISFAALLYAVAHFATVLFPGLSRRLLMSLSTLLFFTSSSLAFWQLKPTSWRLSSLWHATVRRTDFLNRGPYGGKEEILTGLFWTLTIFTNQRHFALGIAYALFIFAFLVQVLQDQQISKRAQVKRVLLLGACMGLLPFFHGLSFVAFMAVLGIFLLLQKPRVPVLTFLAVASLIALPQMLFFSPQSESAAPGLFLGYGVHRNLGVLSFLLFWWTNLGVKWLILPFLFWLVRGTPRKILIASMAIFLLPNLMKFGPDVWTNHKFFNIWLIFINTCLAALLVQWFKGRKWMKVLAAVVLIFSTLSGVIDIFPIFNDQSYRVQDGYRDPVIQFVHENTKPRDTLATSFGIYHPVTLTGRKVLLGWPYFLWSAGYDQKKRMRLTREIFETKNMKRRCKLLKDFGVRYMVAGQTPERSEPYKPAIPYLQQNLKTVLKTRFYLIFDTEPVCTAMGK